MSRTGDIADHLQVTSTTPWDPPILPENTPQTASVNLPPESPVYDGVAAVETRDRRGIIPICSLVERFMFRHRNCSQVVRWWEREKPPALIIGANSLYVMNIEVTKVMQNLCAPNKAEEF
jgi:hypothetical protein